MYYSIIEVSLGSILVFWAILSVINQYKRGKSIRRIKRFDTFGLIPVWTFFAPRPGYRDLHLLYQDSCEDGLLSIKEIPNFKVSSITPVFNPFKRISKVITDVIPHILRDLPQEQHLKVELKDNKTEQYREVFRGKLIESQYLLILNYCMQIPADFRAKRRRIIVARTVGIGGRSRPKILFISSSHKID